MKEGEGKRGGEKEKNPRESEWTKGKQKAI